MKRDLASDHPPRGAALLPAPQGWPVVLRAGLLGLVGLLLRGCSPDPVPCGASNECPGGQICDLMAHACVPMPPVPMGLTVTRMGAGDGRVVSDPAGIECGSLCNHEFAPGKRITLTATPDSRSTFTGWSGACIGTATCELLVSGPVQVFATFATVGKVTLTVTKTGGGDGQVLSEPTGLTCSTAQCAGDFSANTRIKLTAIPDSKSSFTGWADPCRGTSSCELFLTASTTVSATFIPWVKATSPTKNNLHAVWESGPRDVWAVGDAGTIVHYDGAVWTAPSSGTTSVLSAVWGSGPGDVWAVGAAGTTLRYSAGTWTKVRESTANALSGLWGSGPGDVWAVGAAGTILHFDGSAWSPSESGTASALNGVWGTAATNVWAVAADGSIIHYDGKSWSSVVSGTVISLSSIWGSDAASIWAVAADGSIIHYDGKSWSSVVSGTTSALSGLWGSGPLDVWTGVADGNVLHYDGKNWVTVASGTTGAISGVWGGGPGDVWVVGAAGVILHRGL